MNRKSLFTIGACATLAAIVAMSSALNARPIPMYRPADPFLKDLSPMLGAIYSASGPVCESTGFEADEAPCAWEVNEGICGSTFTPFCLAAGGNGETANTGGCTGDPSTDLNCCSGNTNPLNGWYVSISSRWCDQPHVSGANPHPITGGAQHMRFGSDEAVDSGFGTATRVSWFSPTGPSGLTARETTVSYDVAMSDDLSDAIYGSNMYNWFLGEVTNIHFYLYWDYYGVGFVLNYDAGAFQPIAILNGLGEYVSIVVENNPCGTDSQTTGVPGQTQRVASYNEAGAPILSFDIFFPNTGGLVDPMPFRSIFSTDNRGESWDIDNYSIVRSDTACPFECGNGIFEPWGEQCDASAGEDSLCPGRCVDAGRDGECTCTFNCNFCDNDPACELTNGTNGPFITHGGWFSYTADTPFTGFDTCGTDFDTTLWFDIDAAGCAFTDNTIVNDECFDYGGDCSDGNHGPENCHTAASCYNNNTTYFESCLCAATTPGQTYYGWAAAFPTNQPPVGGNVIITITKMLSCGPQSEPIPGGACCDGTTATCSEVAGPEACDGPSLHYTHNKTCDLVECGRDTGACCDAAPGLGGACQDEVLAEGCTGQYQTYYKLTACADITCEEIEGACCNRLTGNCFDSIQAACPVNDTTSWNVGVPCAQYNCVKALGACCDTGSVDPTVATCEQTYIEECVCSKCTWTIDASCSAVVCNPNFEPIPTVSEWGLAILALLLLVGGKIYFGRREEVIA